MANSGSYLDLLFDRLDSIALRVSDLLLLVIGSCPIDGTNNCSLYGYKDRQGERNALGLFTLSFLWPFRCHFAAKE